MSVPNAICIDTSILYEQNYNFSSATISAFLEAIKNRELTLLLPDPTRREIERHLNSRSQEVMKALAQAERQAPFLKKWKGWPVKSNDPALATELQQIAHDDWNSFLKHFEVKDLDYNGVCLEEIMNWYDNQQAPFGAGKKRKEFPDALALTAVLVYARKTTVSVGVVSKDKDFERACALHTELLHFSSLAAFSEALLSAERVSQLKEVIESDTTLIMGKIKESFPSLGFFHEGDYDADIEDVEVDAVTIDKVSIIDIKENVVATAFEATVDYSAYVRMDDHSTASIDSSEDWYMVWQEYRGTVQDRTEISGIVSYAVSPDGKMLKEVLTLDIQQDYICVEEIPEETFLKGED